MLQQRPAFIVGPGGRDNRNIHSMDRCDLVVLNLGKDELFFKSKRVIASASTLWRKRGSLEALATIRHEGRSKKTHILRLRNVTFVPIGIPWRNLKDAMAFFAFVINGFWPVIAPNSPAALSSSFTF